MIQVVWFKRDLRVQDHRALARAAAAGPVLPLYVAEPAYWQEPDMSGRQWAFVAETLAELRRDLGDYGQPLVVRVGEVGEVLSSFHKSHGIGALWSHEETGNAWTYARDLRIADWCRRRSIPWHEVQNHGVQRRLASRNGWAARWDRVMLEPQTPPPSLRPLPLEVGAIPSAKDLGLAVDPCPDRQPGGRRAGLSLLGGFLTERGRNYRAEMSSPLSGARACSRLSPHLAWGSLSMREVNQAALARQAELAALPPSDRKAWGGSMRSFTGRLHWHCHFIQKLEDAPRLETENMHRAYDGLRPAEPNMNALKAWAKGETGLPFVDACMRSLRATGWLNFRMRAMVVSVASYQLWLDWRATGPVLARMFTDYEPGIHWSQMQMQSGTTGINTIRIYNPVKQGYDQDTEGRFIRHWVPELKAIDDKHLHEPWKAENASSIIGHSYPERIVDPIAAARSAREKVWAVRRGTGFGAEAKAIQTKHGSRKSGIRNRGQRPKKPDAQLSLPFGDEPR